MDHSQFIKLIDESGLVMHNSLFYLTDEVILHWLRDNKWVEDPSSRCKRCEYMERKHHYSEEECRLNKVSGGSCYRESLKNHLIPFLRNALLGIYPTLEELQEKVHLRGPLWDGIGELSVLEMIFHELGGTHNRMTLEAAQH